MTNLEKLANNWYDFQLFIKERTYAKNGKIYYYDDEEISIEDLINVFLNSDYITKNTTT